MNLAQLEKLDSQVRQLGLSKLREAELRAQLAKTAFRAKVSEITEFDVVNQSSDEDFDVPYQERVSQRNCIGMNDTISQKWKFRLVPDTYELNRQRKQANLNIRLGQSDIVKSKIEPVDLILERVKKYAIQQKSYAKLMALQKPKIMSHLTPNRNAAQFQQLEEMEKLRSHTGSEFSQGAYMLKSGKEGGQEEDLIQFKRNTQLKQCLETVRLSFEFGKFFAQGLINLVKDILTQND